jgi:hypothetical protein
MRSRVRRATLFALYQLCLVIGILAMPLAMVTRQVGFTLPIHRAIETASEAYETACSE